MPDSARACTPDLFYGLDNKMNRTSRPAAVRRPWLGTALLLAASHALAAAPHYVSTFSDYLKAPAETAAPDTIWRAANAAVAGGGAGHAAHAAPLPGDAAREPARGRHGEDGSHAGHHAGHHQPAAQAPKGHVHD